VDLGTLGGSQSLAYAIHDSGQVVGSSTLSGNVTSHAFLWTGVGGMVDLGSLGGHSGARGVTASGQVVGTSELALPTP
jgi:probable HAF family extracellular repeat protein